MKTKVLRRVLILAVMVLALVSSEFTSRPTQAFACYQFCANAADACMSDCNGDPACEDQCRADFYCCYRMCDGLLCD